MSDPIDDTWYRALFADRLGRRFGGEATPEYAILGVEGLAHIRRLAPSARVIFIMRNPVRQAWSQLLHQCRVRRLDARRLDEQQLREILADERVRALGDYPATLRDVAQVFPKSQLLTLFYEEIHTGRLAAIEHVSAFVGASFEAAKFKGLDARRNKSQDVTLPEGFRAHLRSTTRDLAIKTGEATGRLPKEWVEEYGL
jgi:hypothetical protein